MGKYSTDSAVQNFIDFCYRQHDVVCNQKYDNFHPYSFHLSCVVGEAKKWEHLLDGSRIRLAALAGAAGHDLIEDARITYNDIKAKFGFEPTFGEQVAEIIFACTENRGRDRNERHDESYYELLADNRLAVYVKMCDIISNIKYSILTNSTMLDKYKKEFSKTLFWLHRDDLHPMFVYLNNLCFGISDSKIN